MHPNGDPFSVRFAYVMWTARRGTYEVSAEVRWGRGMGAISSGG